jgi:hypothetical protein
VFAGCISISGLTLLRNITKRHRNNTTIYVALLLSIMLRISVLTNYRQPCTYIYIYVCVCVCVYRFWLTMQLELYWYDQPTRSAIFDFISLPRLYMFRADISGPGPLI